MPKYVLNTSIDTTIEHYEQTHDLDGVEYLFRFDWNRRDGAWYFSMLLPDETELVGGIKVVVGVPFLRGEVDTRLPAGRLIAVDPTGSDQDPGLGDLGARVALLYYDAAEIAAINGS